MENKYNKCIEQWDNIFANESCYVPEKQTTGNMVIDRGLSWICKNTSSILDFGCGNGAALFLTAMNGTKLNVGIDLSKNAIENARLSSKKMTKGEFLFIEGGIESLRKIDSESMDAVILFNIIDNLYPDDAKILLDEVYRILKKGGKVLVKVNDFISELDMKDLDIKVIKDDLLDDGLLLLNKSTEDWTKFFESKFILNHYGRVYYEEFKQYNRMFYLIK